MNLTSSNEKGITDWYLSYKATNLFNVSDMTHIEEMTKIKVEGKYILRRHADAATEKQMYNKKKSKRLNALLLQIVLKIISNALNKGF